MSRLGRQPLGVVVSSFRLSKSFHLLPLRKQFTERIIHYHLSRAKYENYLSFAEVCPDAIFYGSFDHLRPFDVVFGGNYIIDSAKLNLNSANVFAKINLNLANGWPIGSFLPLSMSTFANVWLEMFGLDESEKSRGEFYAGGGTCAQGGKMVSYTHFLKGR